MPKTQNHLELVDDWIAWKDAGIGVVRWSENYRIIQIPYLRKFLEQYPTVFAGSLEAHLRSIPVHQYSKRKHIQSAVSSFAEFLVRKGLLNIKERERIRRLYPKRDRYSKPLQKIITAEQLNTLIEAAGRNHHRFQSVLNTALIRFLALTGLRVSEACTLKLKDINLSAERPHLRVILGKGGKNRVVPLVPEAVTLLEDYLQARPSVSHYQLFIGFSPSAGYQPLDRHAVARRFRRLAVTTGIPFTAHSLRHFAITTWAKDTRLTLPLIQRLAGHSSLAVTEGYLHMTDSDLFDAFSRPLTA